MATGIVLALATGPASAQINTTAPVQTQTNEPIDRETIVVEVRASSAPACRRPAPTIILITSKNIDDLPAGINTVLTDVVAQMPGVGIDQNQQVHIRDTEGSGFQYQINGVQVPFDINTNPPFISMINPLFIDRLDLIDGILPARFSYADGGVLDIKTKDGCEQPGGSATIYAGQRGMVQPSIQYAGCDGKLSYYGSALYSQNNLAFSSATPAPTPITTRPIRGRHSALVSYAIDDTSKISLMFSVSDSDNQLPNDPTLPPQFTLAHAPTSRRRISIPI
jgi:outer membrane cobalamin receptor